MFIFYPPYLLKRNTESCYTVFSAAWEVGKRSAAFFLFVFSGINLPFPLKGEVVGNGVIAPFRKGGAAK